MPAGSLLDYSEADDLTIAGTYGSMMMGMQRLLMLRADNIKTGHRDREFTVRELARFLDVKTDTVLAMCEEAVAYGFYADVEHSYVSPLWEERASWHVLWGGLVSGSTSMVQEPRRNPIPKVKTVYNRYAPVTPATLED